TAVDARADLKTLVLGDVFVLVGQPLLDRNCGTHGETRFREFRHDRITNRLHHGSAKFRYGAGHQIVVSVEEKEPSSVAKAIEIGCRANDVREENGDLCFVSPKLLVDLGSGLKELVDLVHVKVHLYYRLRHPVAFSFI